MPWRSFFLILLLLCTPAYASVQDEIKQTQGFIKDAKDRQESLIKATQKLERNLSTLQKQLVRFAAEVRHHETLLGRVENSLQILQREEQQKIRSLNKKQAQLKAVMEGMVALSRTPPETILAMPGEYEDTLKAAQALGIASDVISKQAIDLKDELLVLKELRASIEEKKALLVKEKAKLKLEQQKLSRQVDRRKLIQAGLYQERISEKKRLQELYRKSESLQELFDQIQRETLLPASARSKQIPLPASKPAPPTQIVNRPPTQDLRRFDVGTPSKKPRKERSFVKAKGRITLPVTGRVTQRFGDKKKWDEKVEGVNIRARGNARVIAPFDGEVVFTGPFRTYGKMVIIRHSGQYHTLLAGMEAVDVAPGQYVLEGEPVGQMGGKGADDLYLELRRKAKPINPALWIDGIS